MNNNSPTVFISCGQYTNAERELGRNVCELFRKQTRLEPYFAQNQTTFSALTENVLGALNRCVGFIGIMHHRGSVETPKGKIIRASVWIEQEIAIAAFIQHILERKIEVQLYIQKEIALEGMREKLLLNPEEFANENEVLAHLKRNIERWKKLEKPVKSETDKLAEQYWGQLDEEQKEAIQLLLSHGPLTDHQALGMLNKKGLAVGPVSAFSDISVKTGMVEKAQPMQKHDHLIGYGGPWRIKPNFETSLKQLVARRCSSGPH